MATRGRAQPRTAPLHQQGTPGFLHQRGRREGRPRLRLGCQTENRPPDPRRSRSRLRQTGSAQGPIRTPAPHGAPRPQPQIHPRGSGNSYLSYSVNLLSPHLLTLIECTIGQELLGDAGEQPPCSGDEGDSTGGQCGHLPAVGGLGHMALRAIAPVWNGAQRQGGALPNPRCAPTLPQRGAPYAHKSHLQGFYATEAKKSKRVK